MFEGIDHPNYEQRGFGNKNKPTIPLVESDAPAVS